MKVFADVDDNEKVVKQFAERGFTAMEIARMTGLTQASVNRILGVIKKGK